MTDAFDPSKLFLSTTSEDASRAAQVLPNGPSEDARHVLGDAAPVSADHDLAEDDDRDCAPNPHAEWAVHVDFLDGAIASKQQITSVLSGAWLRANANPTLYAFSPETNHWTYLHATGTPNAYSRLQVAWRYLPLDAEITFNRDSAQRWVEAVE